MQTEKQSRSGDRRAYNRGPKLKRRGTTWYAFNLFPGHKGTSLQTSDATIAQQRFRELIKQPTANVCRLKATEETLIKITDEFTNTTHGYTRRSKQTLEQRIFAVGIYLEKQGIKYPSEITHQVIDDWITERATTVSRATINRDIRALRVMIRWAAERGLCASTTILDRELREPRRRPPKFTPSVTEVQRTMERLKSISRGALLSIACLYMSGLRIDELRRLTVFDLRDGGIYVSPEPGAVIDAEPTKGYQERKITLHEDAQAIFKQFFAWRATRGGKGKPVGLSDSWLRKLLHRAQDDIKVPRFGLHDLRAAFATQSRNAGIPLTVIQRWLGHADSATTEGYIRATRDDQHIVAPVPAGVQIVADSESPFQSFSVHPLHKNTEKTAPPTRIERATYGLGNRRKSNKTT